MDIVKLIEELEDVIEDANSLPFSKKVSVDPDEIFEIIKEIRDKLPEEIRKAKWVNEEQDRILEEARQEAERITKEAEAKAHSAEQEMQRRFEEMVNAHSITKQSTIVGERIVTDAENEARQIKANGRAHVDHMLANVQENLKMILQELDKNRQELGN